jgi:hypothetical protein
MLIESSIRADGAHVFQTAQSKVIMKSLGGGVFVSQYFGKALGAYVPLVSALWEKEAGPTHMLVLFADCRKLTAYETSYRINVTRWMIQHRDVSDSFHLLSDSAIVRMGIQLVNLVTGGIVQAYSSVADFDDKIRSLIPDFPGIDMAE